MVGSSIIGGGQALKLMTHLTYRDGKKTKHASTKDERIARGDKFAIATDPAILPPVKGGYISGQPNGFFTARELEYLQSKGVTVQPKY